MQKNQNELLTVEQVAKIMRLSPSRVRCRLSQNLPMPESIRFGRRRLFVEQDVYAWIETVERKGGNYHGSK